MADRPPVVSVRVTGVHVECGRCGDAQRIATYDDDFTVQVLMPLGSWWAAHLAPVLAMVELQVDGGAQEWRRVVSHRGVD